MEELERRIAHMRALLRNVTDERAIKAVQDIIADANRTLETLLQSNGSSGRRASSAARKNNHCQGLIGTVKSRHTVLD